MSEFRESEMSRGIETNELPKAVRGALGAVRRRLCAYVLAEGLALLVMAFGIAFWLGLLWDWWFEPTPAARSAAIGLTTLAALYVAYRYLFRRIFVRISDPTAAILLERRFPDLREHVLTVVHFAESPRRAAAYHADMVARTREDAARAVTEVRGSKLFRRAPLFGRSLVPRLQFFQSHCLRFSLAKRLDSS